MYTNYKQSYKSKRQPNVGKRLKEKCHRSCPNARRGWEGAHIINQENSSQITRRYYYYGFIRMARTRKLERSKCWPRKGTISMSHQCRQNVWWHSPLEMKNGNLKYTIKVIRSYVFVKTHKTWHYKECFISWKKFDQDIKGNEDTIPTLTNDSTWIINEWHMTLR